VAQGAVQLAKKRGLQVVLTEAYSKDLTDFRPLIAKVRALNPDAVAASTYFEDAVAISKTLKEIGASPKMFGVTSGGDLPKFYELLGKTGEYVYGASQWESEFVVLRAGGLVPIARQYPGAKEFIEAHRKEYPRTDISYHTAAGYGGCEVLLEAIRRAASLEAEKVRAAILKLNMNTVYGAFKVDSDGFQIGKKSVIFQWQDGKKLIVWPPELAPGQARFPTPPWNQR
jgi:branched-chain amino acid transport system substrate-binding protein